MNENSPFTSDEISQLLAKMNASGYETAVTVQDAIDSRLVGRDVIAGTWLVHLQDGRIVEGFATAQHAWEFGLRQPFLTAKRDSSESRRLRMIASILMSKDQYRKEPEMAIVNSTAFVAGWVASVRYGKGDFHGRGLPRRF